MLNQQHITLCVNLVKICFVIKTLEIVTVNLQTFSKTTFLGLGNPKEDIQSKTQNQYLYDHYIFSILKYTWENKVAKVFMSGGLK